MEGPKAPSGEVRRRQVMVAELYVTGDKSSRQLRDGSGEENLLKFACKSRPIGYILMLFYSFYGGVRLGVGLLSPVVRVGLLLTPLAP